MIVKVDNMKNATPPRGYGEIVCSHCNKKVLKRTKDTNKANKFSKRQFCSSKCAVERIKEEKQSLRIDIPKKLKNSNDYKAIILYAQQKGLAVNRVAEAAGIPKAHLPRIHGFSHRKGLNKLKPFFAVGEQAGQLKVIENLEGRKHKVQCLTCAKTKNMLYKDLLRAKNYNYSCGCKNKTPKGDNGGLRGVYRKYKASAKRRNLEFKLSLTEFENIYNKNCNYCGASYVPTPHSKCDAIDRYDDMKGYTLENTVACCKFCSAAKGAGLTDEFLAYLNGIIERNTVVL